VCSGAFSARPQPALPCACIAGFSRVMQRSRDPFALGPLAHLEVDLGSIREDELLVLAPSCPCNELQCTLLAQDLATAIVLAGHQG